MTHGVQNFCSNYFASFRSGWPNRKEPDRSNKKVFYGMEDVLKTTDKTTKNVAKTVLVWISAFLTVGLMPLGVLLAKKIDQLVVDKRNQTTGKVVRASTGITGERREIGGGGSDRRSCKYNGEIGRI